MGGSECFCFSCVTFFFGAHVSHWRQSSQAFPYTHAYLYQFSFSYVPPRTILCEVDSAGVHQAPTNQWNWCGNACVTALDIKSQVNLMPLTPWLPTSLTIYILNGNANLLEAKQHRRHILWSKKGKHKEKESQTPKPHLLSKRNTIIKYETIAPDTQFC